MEEEKFKPEELIKIYEREIKKAEDEITNLNVLIISMKGNIAIQKIRLMRDLNQQVKGGKKRK